jgi:hypothetical protein
VKAGTPSAVPLQRSDDALTHWKKLRDRWEFSHVVRAVLGLASLMLLATAVAA